MRTSGIRRELLTAEIDGRGQLSLDHASVRDDELEAQLVEEEALAAELRSFARVVTVAYASNPTGLLDLGWGDAELVTDDGRVRWGHWEPLAALLGAGLSGELHQKTASPVGLRAVPVAAAAPVVPRIPRFDDAPFDDNFDLQPRSPLAGEPQQEAAPQPGETGTEDDRP